MRKENILYLLLKSLYQENISTVKNMCMDGVIWNVEGELLYGLDLIILRQIISRFKSSNKRLKVTVTDMVTRQYQATTVICGTYKMLYGGIADEFWKEMTCTVVMENNMVVFAQYNTVNEMSSDVHKIITPQHEVELVADKDIIYAESYKGHIIWHLICGKKLESLDTLENVEKNILSNQFLRIHRCYVVNKMYVKSMQRCIVKLTNGEELPVPYKKYVAVRKQIFG